MVVYIVLWSFVLDYWSSFGYVLSLIYVCLGMLGFFVFCGRYSPLINRLNFIFWRAFLLWSFVMW